MSLADKSDRPVTNLEGRRGFLWDKRIDRQFLYFTWREDISDIWVMDVAGAK